MDPDGGSEMVLDVKEMRCPMPVLRANRALRSLPPGARLRVIATDPASVADVAAFCRETGHTLLESAATNGSAAATVFSFLIRRRASP